MKLSIMHIHIAGIAQLVEHNLAKVGVASSSLVSRSKILKASSLTWGFFMPVMFQSMNVNRFLHFDKLKAVHVL